MKLNILTVVPVGARACQRARTCTYTHADHRISVFVGTFIDVLHVPAPNPNPNHPNYTPDSTFYPNLNLIPI